MTRRSRTTLASVAAFALIALTAAGCASQGGDGASDNDAGGPPAAAAPEDVSQNGTLDSLADGESAGRTTTASSINAADAIVTEDRKLISQGNVQLRSDDVGEALFEVQKVVAALTGEISQNETVTDDEGDVKRAMLVTRIPSARFAEAMQSLEGAAELIASSSNVDDVTTKVIDNQIRLEVQKRSIRRIALLLDRAESIRDIVSIEGQLSQRQAALGSLQRQQAYLADQTQMATITVSLERTKAEAKPEEKKEEEAKGFGAGLDKGWSGFKTVVVGLATATGAALPFLLTLALVGVPILVFVRRSRRSRPTPTEA